MDPKLLELIRDDSRYAYEAYDFVCDCVGFTQEQLGRIPQEEDDPETDYHISGEELIRGGCELAVLEFGMMAPIVFKQWGIHKTDDFGAIVFNLIKAERLSKSDSDDPEDFHELFDLDQVLTDGFELTMGEPRKGHR